MHLIHDIVSSLRHDQKLHYFGGGQVIKLTEQNIVYIESPVRTIGKVTTFANFKENIYWYSELLDTPCVGLLYAMELQATRNAQRSKLAKSNLMLI